MADPRRILVVKLASMGDVLTTTPALRALRSSFPRAHIGVLVTPGSADVLRGLDSVDSVLTFDKFAFDRPVDAAANLAQALRLASDLHRGSWDTLVLLHHLTTPFGIMKYAALSLGSGRQAAHWARQRTGSDLSDASGTSIAALAGGTRLTTGWTSSAMLGARHPSAATPRAARHA